MLGWMVQPGKVHVSRTDKTNPVWVQVYQNSSYRIEEHDHRHHECDLLPLLQTRELWSHRGTCVYDISSEGNQHVWRRCSRYEQIYRKKSNGRSRTSWRNQKRALLKMGIESIYDCEFTSYPHRHQALWDIG